MHHHHDCASPEHDPGLRPGAGLIGGQGRRARLPQGPHEQEWVDLQGNVSGCWFSLEMKENTESIR